MFKRLRVRLTVVCALITSVILIGMAVSSFQISAYQLRQRADESFASDLSAVLSHLGSQRVLDHTWLSQTEAGGLLLCIEDAGRPLLYRGSWTAPFRQEVSDRVKQAALDRFGFDLSLIHI